MIALLSVFWALLSVLRAVLSVYRALLRVYRALLSVYRALQYKAPHVEQQIEQLVLLLCYDATHMSKEIYKRALKKRPAKETYRKDLKTSKETTKRN